MNHNKIKADIELQGDNKAFAIIACIPGDEKKADVYYNDCNSNLFAHEGQNSANIAS